MKQDKKWETLNKLKVKSKKLKVTELIDLLLENRGLKTKKDIEEFLHPKFQSITPSSLGIDIKDLKKTIERISTAIENKEQIVVFGDYDVDGVTGTAILWETLNAMGAKVIPYIPNRVDEGYGLSIKGIENCKLQIENCSLFITVDNGIVANEAVEYARKLKIDVIITDHHTAPQILPKAYSIVHTTSLCGAGVAWVLEKELVKYLQTGDEVYPIPPDHLDLVALATVADLVPLQKANRALLTEGLKEIKETTRPGILALLKVAQVDKEQISVYTIGHIIAPRLNAMGRMESAMDSLRLLCTRDRLRAMVLADKLHTTNKERQEITKTLTEVAVGKFKDKELKNLLFIAHEDYEEGVIGLVAGKLVEEYYRPAIVVSKGIEKSKASARSVAGFNIIEFIRASSHLLINAGGHPMAAGFTVATENLPALQKLLEERSEKEVELDLLKRVVKIDSQINLNLISAKLYENIQNLAPFGMGNPEPVFSSKVIIKDIRQIGAAGVHLKLLIGDAESRQPIPAIGFGMGYLFQEIKKGQEIEIAYTVDENIWNGKKEIQLKLRDVKF